MGSKILKNNKKLKVGIWVLSIVVVLALLYSFIPGMKESMPFAVGEDVVDEDLEKEILLAKATCPDDGITTLNIELEDDYASTTTTLTGTNNIKIMDVTTGKIVTTDSSSNSAWASTDVDCGNEFIVYVVSDSATSGSAMSEQFVASGNNQYLTLHTNQLSKHTVKVKDIAGDEWEHLYADNSNPGANATTGVDMNKTLVFEDNIATDIAIGSDGYLDMDIYVKSATNRYKANDHGKLNEVGGRLDLKNYVRLDLKNYVCVDLGGTTNGQEWDTNSLKVTFEGGDALSDMKSSIDPDSQEYLWLQNSEACYQIGNVGDTYKILGFYVKAKASEDPDATDDDVTIYFLGEGLYASSDVSNTIKTGIFSDASTQVGVLFDLGAEDPYVVFQIS